MSAPIRRNDAETFAEEKKHLRVPIIRRERPAVTEHNRLSFAPVFIIDVDVSSVFFSNSYVWHNVFSFWLGFLLDDSLTQTTCDEQRFAGDPFGIV